MPAVVAFVVVTLFQYPINLFDDVYILFVLGVLAATLLRLSYYPPARCCWAWCPLYCITPSPSVWI